MRLIICYSVNNQYAMGHTRRLHSKKTSIKYHFELQKIESLLAPTLNLIMVPQQFRVSTCNDFGVLSFY